MTASCSSGSSMPSTSSHWTYSSTGAMSEALAKAAALSDCLRHSRNKPFFNSDIDAKHRFALKLFQHRGYD